MDTADKRLAPPTRSVKVLLNKAPFDIIMVAAYVVPSIWKCYDKACTGEGVTLSSIITLSDKRRYAIFPTVDSSIVHVPN